MKKVVKVLSILGASLLLVACSGAAESSGKQSQGDSSTEQKHDDSSTEQGDSSTEQGDSSTEQQQEDGQSEAPVVEEECADGWAGKDCSIENSCVYGTPNLGRSGDGHCKVGSCIENYAGMDCDRCPEDTAEFMYGRDCQRYKVTIIDGSTWMAENMADQSSDVTCYANTDADSDYIKDYGCLYIFDDAPKVCPTGWHVPTDAEFEALLDFAKDNSAFKNSLIALMAKSETCEGKVGADEFGFSGLLAGVYFDGNFEMFRDGGYWWSSTKYVNDDDDDAGAVLYLTEGEAEVSFDPVQAGLSVRCLKD